MTILCARPQSVAKLLLAIGLIGLLGMPAQADDGLKLKNIGVNSEDAKTTGSAKEAKAGSTKPAGSTTRSGILMRCWNYGRLVYESPVSGFVTSSPSGNVVTVPGSPQKQILDMRSGLCVIE